MITAGEYEIEGARTDFAHAVTLGQYSHAGCSGSGAGGGQSVLAFHFNDAHPAGGEGAGLAVIAEGRYGDSALARRLRLD